MSARFLTVVALLTASQIASHDVALAQPVPLGPEFQVNTYTTSVQVQAAVASDSAGNFVVVWTSGGSTVESIQGQRYDSAGTAQGGQFQVNTYTTDGQFKPAVAATAAGSFVVVWEGYGGTGTDTADLSIQGQRYDSAGVAQGAQFQVNTYTTNRQFDVAVASDSTGNFVVVWESRGSVGSDTSSYSIQGQRYDSAGVAQGGQFQVNTYTTSSQSYPAVATDSAGNFVVVWTSEYGTGDTDPTSVQAQRYDGSGTPVGGQFQVNTYTTMGQRHARVASDSAGNFVVVWESSHSDGLDTSSYSIQGQRYDSAGVAQGGQFQVNTYTTSEQHLQAVASDSAGNFVAVWASDGSAGSDTGSYSIQGQRYDSAGTAQGGQFQVNTYTTSIQRFAAVASDSAGNFVVVWDSFGSAGSDTSHYSIHGQRFAPTFASTSTTSSSSSSSSSSTTSTTLPTTLLPGRVAIIKPGTLAKFVAKSATGDAFMLPAASTVAMGGSLRIFDTTTGAGDVTYPLPVVRWLSLGPAGANGYKYKGAGSIGDPCKVVLVKEKIIKGVCKGTGVTLHPPFVGDVGIVLSLGTTDRYCAQFGGDETRNDATLTKRKNAPAPGACP